MPPPQNRIMFYLLSVPLWVLIRATHTLKLQGIQPSLALLAVIYLAKYNKGRQFHLSSLFGERGSEEEMLRTLSCFSFLFHSFPPPLIWMGECWPGMCVSQTDNSIVSFFFSFQPSLGLQLKLLSSFILHPHLSFCHTLLSLYERKRQTM